MSKTVRRAIRVGVFLFGCTSACLLTLAQPANTGSIQGQILNASSGSFLNNARVTIPGTTIEGFTNETGHYWLTNVPVGSATVEVRFIGLDTQAATVAVTVGAPAVQNFDLNVTGSVVNGKVVQMEALSVESRAMTGQAVALTEQRNAPNIKNVISLDEFVDQAEGNIGEFIKYIPGWTCSTTRSAPNSSPSGACRRVGR